jgi:hypothetical protein
MPHHLVMPEDPGSRRAYIARPVSQMFGHWIFRRMYQWQVRRFIRDAEVRNKFVPLLYEQFDATPSGWVNRRVGGGGGWVKSLVGNFTGIGACHRKLISHLDQSRISVSLPKF